MTPSDRAALVTGGSGGIGVAIAEMLAEEEVALTLVARHPPKLEAAVERLTRDGARVQGHPADVRDEAQIAAAVEAHRQRYGRLDVLVNAAGVGIGEPIAELQTKRLDLQLSVNLRASILFCRECRELLQAAGAEHGNALVVNLASIVGKRGAGVVSVYSAAKAGVVAWTEAMNKELAGSGVKATALCPGLVDTRMTHWIKGTVPPERMIRPRDVSEAVRFLLRTSPNCVVPELIFLGPTEWPG